MSYRAAVIGLGGIAGAHLAGWKETEGVEVVAGADVNTDAVSKAEADHGLTGYADWREMLDKEKLDLVSICTPPFLHREMTVEALQRGLHVMCEKPMAADIADAEVMAAAAEQTEAVLAIAYCHRFHGPMMKLKELMDEGIIGTPIFFRGGFTGMVKFDQNHRANKKMAGGGSLMDNGSHATDLFVYLVGNIANVSCRAGRFMQEMETEDVGITLFTAANGCIGEIVTGYSLPGEFTQWMITGDKGIVKVDDYFSGPVLFRTHDSQEWVEYACDNSQTRFQRQFAHFIECIRDGKQPLSNAENALHVQRVIDAAYKEAEQPGIHLGG